MCYSRLCQGKQKDQWFRNEQSMTEMAEIFIKWYSDTPRDVELKEFTYIGENPIKVYRQRLTKTLFVELREN